MKEFFVTFGQKYRQDPHPLMPEAHPDGYFVVEAEDMGQARDKVVESLGQAWAFIYSEEEFKMNGISLHPKGELARIK